VLGERGREARLADPRIAEDQVHATAARAGALVRIAELLQLTDATDEWALA
jgi:hypothetical protein